MPSGGALSTMRPTAHSIALALLLTGCAATTPTTRAYPPAPQHDDKEWKDGTCCIEPGRCGGLNIFVPQCARDTSFITPPTRNQPVPRPPPPPTPPTSPLQPILTCWDGSTCPGRVEEAGIQCCSVRVMSGVTCSQIFICDKGRTCTGPETCYQRECAVCSPIGLHTARIPKPQKYCI